MLGRGNTGASLGSRAVDADLWALICEDEEWLNAAFYEVISAAEETPTGPARRLPTDTARERSSREAVRQCSGGDRADLTA